MNKFKKIIALVVFTLIIYSCGDNNNIVNPFADVDHAALTITENDSIVSFLQSHYYDANLDSIKPITSGQEAMFTKVSKVNVTENNIDHILYVYIIQEGKPGPKKDNPLEVKSNPTEVDSIFVNRTGAILENNTVNFNSAFDSGNRTWWSLIPTLNLITSAPSPILGWVKGFPLLKSGKNATNNGPITYSDTGKAYFFIPSGLAYTSVNYQIGQTVNPLFDKTIVFKVELLDIVENTDHDNDGVPTINEDINGDKNYTNDDTDSDVRPNYLDTDDDGDGILTLKEDANNDGNPANDFSDSSNATLPDYLNPSIK